jgi:hypothetical protein
MPALYSGNRRAWVSLEMEQEVADELKPRSKGMYLLPNLLTTGCMFSGFYGIVAAIDKHFTAAGEAIFVAMIFDTLDGRMARLTKTESAFGKEYDSLADMVSFGIAPAIVAYQWGVVRIAESPAPRPPPSSQRLSGFRANFRSRGWWACSPP